MIVDLPSVLASIAEGSITLAGFAAVFRAFRGGEDPAGLNRIRLNIVIEGGLLVALLCYFPVWLSAEIGEDWAWRISSLIAAIWGFFRFNIPAFKTLLVPGPVAVMFFFSAPMGVISVVAGLLNAFGYLHASAYSGHLLTIMMALGNVGGVFVAQFRAELARGT